MTRRAPAPSAFRLPTYPQEGWAGRKALLGTALLPLACCLLLLAAPAGAAAPTTIAGYGEGAGQVVNPIGVAVDQSSGDLYVAEANNRRISKFGPDGEFLLAWGSGVADPTEEGLQVCGPAAEPPTKRCFKGDSSSDVPGSVRPYAVAVEQSSHDVYVADAQKRRVTRFGPSGELRFLFGPDVALSGPGNGGADETQEVTVEASGGAFTLTLTAPVPAGEGDVEETTAPIPYDASAPQVEEALEELPGVEAGDLAVTGGPGDATGSSPYAVEFSDGPFAGNDVEQMVAGGSQSVALQGATGGAFELAFEKETTAPIPYDATAAQVREALEALETIGAGNVSVAGPAGGPWTVTFSGALAGEAQPLLGADDGALAPGGATASVARAASVATTAPGGGLESCEPDRGDACKKASGAGLDSPSSLAFDPEGDLWIGDTERLQEIAPDGTPGEEVALPGAGDTNSLAVDSAGDFFTVTRAVLERQVLEFEGLADEDTFTLGNLPAACSAASTGPIEYAGGPFGPSETNEEILAALEAKCGAGSFSLGGGFGGVPITFKGSFAGVDEPLLSCAVASGSGSCSVAAERDGRLGKVQKLDGGSGAVIETPSEGGQPRAIALDGEDNLYLGDTTNPYRLIKFDPAGEKTSQFGAGQVIGEPGGNGLSGANALAVDDSAQTLYVASSGTSEDNSAVQAFAVPEPGPLPDFPRAEEVRPTTATLEATLNPEGAQTTWRFEYVSEADFQADKNAGGDGYEGPGVVSKPEPEATLPGEEFDSEEVEAAIEHLVPSTTYRFRLLATNHCDPEDEEVECTVATPDTAFTTLPAVGIEAQWATDVAARSAALHADLDPLGAEGATWWVEYGVGGALDRESAHEPLVGPVEARVALGGLAPATTYSYRFAAAGTQDGAPYLVEGPERSLTTQRGSLGFSLPDSRAWEMVSPPDKHGGTIDTKLQGEGALQAAASGEAVAYLSRGSIEARPEGNRGLEESSVLSRRGPGGAWGSRDITPPHTSPTAVAAGKGLEYKLFGPELRRALLGPRDATPLSPLATERTPYLRTDTEPPSYEPLVTAANALPGFGGNDRIAAGAVSVSSATADLRHVVLSSSVPLLEGVAEGGLYAWSEEAPAAESLEPLSVLPGGEVVPAKAGTGHGGTSRSVRHAISADGARAFWTPGPVDGLYVRDLEREETARLDVVRDGFGFGDPDPVFQDADPSGDVALFTDSRELTADASAGGRDLYRCELSVEPDLGCDLANLSGPAAAPGEAARVLGLLAGMSEDATRVYLVARGVLDETANSEEDSAVAGEPNLYAWSEGEGMRFVATLSEGDSGDWGALGDGAAYKLTAAASPSGRYLAFMSKRPLTGYDNRDASSGERAQEVFRYDAAAGELTCVSCDPSGARPQALVPGEAPLERYFDPQKLWSGQPVAALVPEATKITLNGESLYRPRAVHDNGRVFFNAADSLVPADSNGDGDVYQYEPLGSGSCAAGSGDAGVARIEGGCVALVSSGGPGGTAAFLDASAGGDDVFFFTPAQLSVTDTDRVTDVYDARVGGVPATLSLSAECQGEACQSPAAAPEAPAPASAAFRGPGNLAPASRGRCARPARRARRIARKAKRLRRGARRLARNQRRGKARRMRRGARRLAHRARRTSRSAKRCRARARTSRRSSR